MLRVLLGGMTGLVPIELICIKLIFFLHYSLEKLLKISTTNTVRLKSIPRIRESMKMLDLCHLREVMC